MSKRRALLIGVSEYESDAIPDLPIVCQDLKSLHAALEKSGFAVRSLGEDGLSYGRSKILQTLRRECKAAQKLEILLLYFSGHGMHFRGKDYLIPSDAALDDAEAVEEYLVPIDLGSIIDQSDAKTIIFFVDACREGIKLGFKDTYLAGWSRGERRQATQRSFVLVFACSPGQVSHYVGGERGFSLFSQALAEVLDPKHSACTVRDVLDETQARLNALAAEHKKQPQKIYWPTRVQLRRILPPASFAMVYLRQLRKTKLRIPGPMQSCNHLFGKKRVRVRIVLAPNSSGRSLKC